MNSTVLIVILLFVAFENEKEKLCLEIETRAARTVGSS